MEKKQQQEREQK
jgi:arginine/serine-rich splicing factor 12